MLFELIEEAWSWGPGRVTMAAGLVALVWVVVCLRRKRGSWLPLGAMTVLIPIGGFWAERIVIPRLTGLQPDQLAAAWSKLEGETWGYQTSLVLLASMPAACVLLLGLRVEGERWHVGRAVWALAVGIVAVALGTFGMLAGGFALLVLPLLVGLGRGAWVVARAGGAEAERRTVAITIAILVALIAASFCGNGLIPAFVNHTALQADQKAALAARRALEQDRTWLQCLAVTGFVCLPLLTKGIRGWRVLLAFPFIVVPLYMVWPARVRAVVEAHSYGERTVLEASPE